MNDRIAYFDNAATTFPKPEIVYDYADSFYRSSGGNIGRGGNSLAVAAGKVAQQAKTNLRKLYHCEAREVVFTASATDSLNRILFGLDIAVGDNIYVSPFEHNAVTRPVKHLVDSFGANLEILPFSKETLLPDWEAIDKLFRKNPPRLLVVTHASNVCGAVLPVNELCALAKEFDAITVIDMSQTAGLIELNLAEPQIDFAVFAGHKTLYAPFGVGGFFCDKNARLKPVLFGGNGVDSMNQDMPDNIVQMEEIGSQNTYALAGLKASTEWILSKGIQELRREENASRGTLMTHLENHNGITLIPGAMECDSIGVVSALFDNYSPDEVEMLLGKLGVAVRSGIQCAPFAHKFLGTAPSGTVRFSVSALTTNEDFELLEEALATIEDSY